jgi:hypothetical protein
LSGLLVATIPFVGGIALGFSAWRALKSGRINYGNLTGKPLIASRNDEPVGYWLVLAMRCFIAGGWIVLAASLLDRQLHLFSN